MPELPEVEVVRRGLARWITGRTVEQVQVLHPRAVRRHDSGADAFKAELTGCTITSVERRGKYLWFVLDEGEAGALVAHLGMSGQLLLVQPTEPDGPHMRVRLRWTVGGDHDRELRFVDQRTFGGLLIEPLVEGSALGRRVPASVAHIAPDPWEIGFDRLAAARGIRARRTGLKRALLDQTLVSGIGNIYADEALWLARQHYARRTESMTTAQIAEVLDHAADVMSAALAQGGTSFDALYVDVNGSSGYFARSLNAYGQEGEPCARCARVIVREAFMNRSSFRCPSCQRRPRQPHR
jgi:formamidopyrimidine-DNA glycosylase